MLAMLIDLQQPLLAAKQAYKKGKHHKHSSSSDSHKKSKKNCNVGSLIAEKIYAGTVTANQVNAGTVTADEVDAGAITVNGCQTVRGVVIAEASLEKPCFTFTCDATVNIQDINISKTLVASPGTLINPLADLPILTPGSDTTCPDEPSGGDPLVTAILDQDASFQQDWLIFTNTSDTPTAPAPKPSSGPWYFEKEPYQTSDKTVITCGCREVYDPSSLGENEQFPSIGGDTNSTI